MDEEELPPEDTTPVIPDEPIIPEPVEPELPTEQPITETEPPITTMMDASSLRRAAFTSEADPLFFKAQRGEATHEEWLAKIEEIRVRFPHPQQ